MKRPVFYAFSLALSAMMLFSCDQKGDSGIDVPVELEKRYVVAPTSYTGVAGETFTPSLTEIQGGKRSDYDLVKNPDHIAISSSNSSVATVGAAGTVTLKAPGECRINFKDAEEKQIAYIAVSVRNNVFNEPQFDRKLDEGMILGQFILGSNNNPQCIDIDKRGHVWLEGVTGNTVHVQRYTVPGKYDSASGSLKGYTRDEEMLLLYAGHGTTLCVETGNDQETSWFWYSNYASKVASGGYQDSQVLSRTKYKPGETLYPEDADEHFFLGEDYHSSFHYLDFEHGNLAVFSTAVGKLTIFKIADILAAPVADITLKPMIWGGDTDRYKTEATVTPTIKAHDCRGVKPVKVFNVTKKTAMGGSACQGFCCTGENADCFFLKGVSTEVDVALSRFNAGKGQFDYICKPFVFDDSISEMSKFGITESVYLEAEGVTVRFGKMYICVASKINKNRISTVLLVN